jgi:hypothetical protein
MDPINTMINVGRSGLSGGMNFTAPLSLHSVERRKHRRVVRLSEEICDTRKAIFVVSQDCRCGKKCLDRKDVDLSEVLEIIKHLRRQTFGRSYEDVFTLIRHKLEAAIKSQESSRPIIDFTIGLPGRIQIKVCRYY